MKNEKYKRLFRFGCSIISILFFTLVFYVMWMEYYNERIDQSFARRGNWLIAGIYFVVFLLFSHIYGGFKIGYQKPSNLMLSCAIASVGANFVIYLVILLLAREAMFRGETPAVYPLLLVCLAQAVGAGVMAAVMTKVYNTLFPPRRLLMVCGEYEEAADELERKMQGLKEKYVICSRINQDIGYEKIVEEIRKYEGVVLIDVEVSLRNHLIKYCYGAAIRVYVAPNISDIILSSAEVLHFFDSPLLLARNSGLSIEQKLAKRLLDLFISGVGIVVTSPFMLITALAIKLYDGGPVFFRQARVTNGGRVFMITKFRSMIVDAEKEGHSVPATERDPRSTPVGRVIRATRLDELPQLFDIFRGDMSVVGPRPERVEHVEKYTKEIPEFGYRLKVKGGLTGYAQIYGKYNTSAYDKLKLDLMYIENYSFLLDLKLILMTIKIIFMKESTEGFSDKNSAHMGE